VGSSKVISMAAAASLINDGDVVTVSSSSGLGCPDAMLAAIGARFEAEGHPRQLTLLHPIAAGDMYGVKGVDHLAKHGLIKSIIAGSFPSGPSSLPMPDIWRMVVDNEIRAYNLPSGVMFDMHRDAAAKRPGVLTKVGLDTFVDPDRQGGAMNRLSESEPVVEKVTFAGEEWLFFPNIVPRVAIVRATTADEKGNLSYEHEGALLGGRDQALAVRNNGGIVIAQVKRVVKGGSLDTQQVHIPCNLVDYVVVDRERCSRLLHGAYADGRMSVDELESRLHRVERASSRVELVLLARARANRGLLNSLCINLFKPDGRAALLWPSDWRARCYGATFLSRVGSTRSG
jgi:propionate CoA-transferase